MQSPLNYKLPFLKIIAAAIFFEWTNMAELLKAISVPTLVLVVIWGVWIYFSDQLPPFLSWMLFLSYIISKAVSSEADLVWTSDKRLLVRHTKSLDWAVVPTKFDDVQIVFE
jgi:hypothetical protein